MKLIGRPFWTRENGPWLWVQKYQDELGKERKLRVPRDVAPTKSAAHARAAAAWIAERVDAKRHIVLTVAELAARMLELWKADTRIAPKTFEDREGHLRLHLLPTFGGKRPEDVTIPALRAWVRSQRDAGVSRSGVNNRLSTLATLLNDAAAEGLTKTDGSVARHAAVRRELPEAPVSAPKTLPPAAVEALLEAPTTPLVWAVRYALAALAGFEDGVIAGLTWGDLEDQHGGRTDGGRIAGVGERGSRGVDGARVRTRGLGGRAAGDPSEAEQAVQGVAGLREGDRGRNGRAQALSVRRAVAQKGPKGWASVSKTKNVHRGSDEAPRRVPVHPALAVLLEAWFREGFRAWTGRNPKPEDYILPSTKGEEWRPDSARHLRRHLDAARVPYPEGLVFHDLRGSFMTWLAALDVPLEQRQRLVGQAGSVQAEHYLGPEALLEADRRAVDLIPVTVCQTVCETKNGRPSHHQNPTKQAPPAGIGPATFGLGIRCFQGSRGFRRDFWTSLSPERSGLDTANEGPPTVEGLPNGLRVRQDEPREAAVAALRAFEEDRHAA